MTICDLCLSHVKERYKLKGKKIYHLTNLLSSNLKKTSDDDLLELYSWIKTGIMVCKDCSDLCKKINNECHESKNMTAYRFRIKTDQSDLEKIEAEVVRRTNIRKMLKR